jgi:hypothetical protein
VDSGLDGIPASTCSFVNHFIPPARF